MDREHDVMTVICNAPVIWWPQRGVRGMNLKPVCCRYDSQRCVHFRSHWISEMDPPCVNTWCDVTGKCWNSLKQISPYSHNKKLFDSISEGAWELPSYHFLIFCRFRVNYDDITIVMLIWSSSWCSISIVNARTSFQNVRKSFRIACTSVRNPKMSPTPDNHDWYLNTLKPGQNGRNFAGDIFKFVLVEENGCILINMFHWNLFPRIQRKKSPH